jgi:hypothetical protein
VEKGSHLVELVYDPLSFKIGLALTASALAVLVGSSSWLLVGKRRSRHNSAIVPPRDQAQDEFVAGPSLG